MSLVKSLKICSNCLYSSGHAYPMLFSGGLCSGCLVHKEKEAGVWVDRANYLKSQIVKHNSEFNSNNSFDCIIPVTGAGDSFGSAFVAGLIKYDWNIDKALKLAILNSAHVIKKIGAQEGLLKSSDLKKYKL